MSKLYDCFTFFNELDLLRIRLAEHDSAVDYFVLVEATYTHQNRTKPLYFSENKPLFGPYLHKIIHVVVDDKPQEYEKQTNKTWLLENYQRNAIIRGLQNADANDLILISDIDEIIKKEVLTEAKFKNGSAVFGLKHYAYFANAIVGKPIKPKYKWFRHFLKSYYHKYLIKKYWFGPAMVEYKNMSSAQQVRNNRENLAAAYYIYTNCGWHFSYLGGTDKIIEKLNALNEEFDYSPYKNAEYINACLLAGKDIFNNGTLFTKDSDFCYPLEMQSNYEKYKSYFLV